MIKRHPAPEGYTVISPELTKDHTMPFESVGLGMYMLSYPAGEEFTKDRLLASSPKDTEATIDAALRGLKRAGHVEQSPSGAWVLLTEAADENDGYAR